MNEHFDVIILGAGAAGLMCAAEAGKRGRKTLVLDNAKKPGRKILISGGGRCNFTNYDITAQNFVCQNPHFVKSALSQYTNWDFISMVATHGIEFEEREHGQLFCQDSAKQIVKMLLEECDLPSVSQRYRTDIEKIEKIEKIEQIDGEQSRFKLTIANEDKATASNKTLTCESLVVATGGLSMPKLGATPYGYKIAEQFGLNIVPTTAGLVPFTLHTKEKEAFSTLSGIAVDAEVTTQSGVSFKEALLFTHRGLSGPVILQASSYWQAGQSVTINLLPNEDVAEFIEQAKANHPNQSVKNTLSKLLPKRLIDVLLAQGLIDKNSTDDRPLKQLTHQQQANIVSGLEAWQLLPNGTEGYRTAEVTLGGVDTKHLSSKTMECQSVKGLYFAGEVMDVSGWLGGYNFQWAWSSGYVAGQWV